MIPTLPEALEAYARWSRPDLFEQEGYTHYGFNVEVEPGEQHDMTYYSGSTSIVWTREKVVKTKDGRTQRHTKKMEAYVGDDDPMVFVAELFDFMSDRTYVITRNGKPIDLPAEAAPLQQQIGNSFPTRKSADEYLYVTRKWNRKTMRPLPEDREIEER